MANKELLEANNFFVVRDFLHQEGAELIAAEFKKYCITNFNKAKPDRYVPGSPAVYGHDAIEAILFTKIFYMNDLVGERLYPTYCYARWYKTGAELLRHTDAEACEISVSVNLAGDEWPIFMTKPDGSTEGITLKQGDAVVYKGAKSIHWREKFTGKECIQAFLHYVKVFGPNYHNAFDMVRNPRGSI